MLWWLLACADPSPPTHAVRGVVVELRGDRVVVLDHEEIPGVMEPMVMPFTAADPSLLLGLRPGDRVDATWELGDERSQIVALSVRERARPPANDERPPPLAPGQAVPDGALFPSTPIVLADGPPIVIGDGQDTGGPVGLTFVYTRGPVPEFCPLVVSRFQALQEQLPPRARLIAVTMDPDYDTRSVLSAFALASGARSGRWDFGRVPKEVLFGLAEKSGLAVHGRGTGITHGLVFVILDAEGRVVRRYDHFDWDMAEVVALLGG